MIRKLIVALIFTNLFPWNATATHLMGGEITWECLGSGNYIFQMKVYRDCATAVYITNAGPIALRVFNHPSVTSIPMNIVDSADISPQCNGSGPSYDCASPNGNTAVKEYILRSNAFNLPGIPPPQGWIFTWSNCCRNASITNLLLSFSGPGNPSNGFTLRAKMFAYNGIVASPCFDSSPRFQERPSIIICAASPYTYNPNAYDPDLDSLNYAFDYPLDYLPPGSSFTSNNPPNIPFESGYSINNPFPGNAQNINNVPVSLNTATGEMTFTSFNTGNYVQVIKVTAYKCGQKVAEIYREIQTVILSCGANQPPVVTAPFINTATGNYTNYIDTVIAGDVVSFSITGTDYGFLPTGFPQNLIYTAQGGQFGTGFTDAAGGCDNLPCATINPPPPQSGSGSLTLNFNWQTGCEHVAEFNECITNSNLHTFTFTFRDDYCPAPSYSVVTATIVVLAVPIIESPQMQCASVLDNGDVVLSWKLPDDTANTFNSYHIYASATANGPFTEIDSIFNYTQNTYLHVGANAQQMPMFYYIRSRSGCFGQVLSPPKDTIQTIFVNIGNAVGNNFSISWNALHNPGLPTSYPNYNIYKQVNGGPWQLIANTPNLIYYDEFTTCSANISYRIELPDSSGCISISKTDTALFVNNTAPADLGLDSASVDLITQLVQLGWTAPPLDTDVDTYTIMQEINGTLSTISTVANYNSTFMTNPNSMPGIGSEVYGIVPEDSCDNLGNAAMLHHTIFLKCQINGCLGKAELSWTPYIGFGDIASYSIYVQQDNLQWEPAATVAGNMVHYTHPILQGSSVYCFYVRAFASNGYTASSNKVCLTADIIDLADYTYLNVATVENDYKAYVKCLIDTSADIASYLVTRRLLPFGEFDTIGVFTIDTYDEFIHFYDNGAKTQETAYEYRISIIDACGNITGVSNIGTTILLQGNALDGFVNTLHWNQYELWSGRVGGYKLFQCAEPDKKNASLIAEFDSIGAHFEHDVAQIIPPDGRICYYVEANEGQGNVYGYIEKSTSNVVCLTQEPVLYIPNAFVIGGNSGDFGPRGIFATMTKKYNFSVWNRWGEKIFETTSPGNNWDATYMGAKVPIGVYVYMIDFESVKGKIINRHGIVTVIE